MPFESKAQNRLARWTVAHPALASARDGMSPKVAAKFIADSHGQKVRDLPDRIGKCEGGAMRKPPPFRW